MNPSAMNLRTPSMVLRTSGVPGPMLPPLDLADHYWIVAEATDQVYSSKTNTYVPVADAAYFAWLDTGMTATPIATEAEIWDSQKDIKPRWLFNGETFAQPSVGTYTPDQLSAYNSDMRAVTQNSDITVNGHPFSTGLTTTEALNTAVIYSQSHPDETFAWKLPDGSFVTLAAADITALQNIISKYGQDCYACEDANLTGIEDGTITTPAQIDAAFAAVQNSFDGVTAMTNRRHAPKK
jgi:hypothetical protein